MMTAKEYIMRKMDEISGLLNNVCLKYAYDETTDFHIIEVSPESIRRGSDIYMEKEYEIWEEFSNLFPNEDLLISEESEMNNTANVIYKTEQKKLEIGTQKYCGISFVGYAQQNIFTQNNNYTLAA